MKLVRKVGGDNMTLEVNKKKMIIMGVQFENPIVFDSVWYAVSSNMIEGWEPKVEDIIRLKDRATNLLVVKNG